MKIVDDSLATCKNNILIIKKFYKKFDTSFTMIFKKVLSSKFYCRAKREEFFFFIQLWMILLMIYRFIDLFIDDI